MMRASGLVLAACLASPVAAQQFVPPQGCTGTLTVQHKSCVMINVWSCADAPAGDQWIALIGQDGVFSVQHVDAQFQWLESYKATGTETLQTPAPDAASLDELLDTQLDTWDFTLDTADGAQRNVGFDMLTGETTVIDGETLLNTEFQGRTIDANGTEIEASSGRQFVSPAHRLFFFGQAWDDATPDQVIDMTPLAFIYPGAPGFFGDTPTFECDVIESALRP